MPRKVRQEPEPVRRKQVLREPQDERTRAQDGLREPQDERTRAQLVLRGPQDERGRGLDLQRAIGNQAVQRLIQRQGGGGKAPVKITPRVIAHLELDSGSFDGGSKVQGHEGGLELESLRVGSRRPLTSPGSKGGGSREEPEAEPVDVYFTRRADDASVKLYKLLLDSVPIKTARFDFVSSDESGAVTTTFTLNAAEGYLATLQAGSGGGEGVDSGAFNFKAVG